jgi:hypothetical protein
MRLLAIVIALIAGSACTASVQGSWQKPGADGQMTGRDTSTCRDIARGEAAQKYPDRAGSPAPFGVPSAQQRDDLSRTTYEVSRFESCMQDLGYRRA